jgi:hypothetical protein
MDPSQLRKEILEHTGGPVAELLVGSGMFEGKVAAARARTDHGEYYVHGVNVGSPTYIDLGTFVPSVWQPVTFVAGSVRQWTWDTTGMVIIAPPFPPTWIVGESWALVNQPYTSWQIQPSGDAVEDEEMEWAKAA